MVIIRTGIDIENCTVNPVATDQFPRPARRPANSSLDTGKIRLAYGIRPRPWQDALSSYFTRRAETQMEEE